MRIAGSPFGDSAYKTQNPIKIKYKKALQN